jgi:hypothetical protein
MEHPTSKRDNLIRIGATLVCMAAAGCVGNPLRVMPDAGMSPAVAGANGGAGTGGGGAAGIDENGHDGAAGCSAPNPNGCAYPDEHATCPGNPAECLNGEWQCPFGVACTPDNGSDNEAPDGGDADTSCPGITISTGACASGNQSFTPTRDADSLLTAIVGAWTKCDGPIGGNVVGQVGLLINGLGGAAQIPTDGSVGETLGTVNALSATSPSCAAQEDPFIAEGTYASVTWSFTETAFGAGARFEYEANGATYDMIDLPTFSVDGKHMTLTGGLWAGTYVLTEAL